MPVEGTWFDEQGVLSELSGVADSVTGESFEVLQGVSPQLDAARGTASARMKPNADLGKTHHGLLGGGRRSQRSHGIHTNRRPDRRFGAACARNRIT